MVGMMMLAAAAGVAAPPAMTPALRGDVRCMTIYAAGVEVLDKPEEKQLATVGMVYFYGRVEQRLTTAELASAIQSEGKILETKEAAAEGARCDSEFSKVGERLTALGKAITP